ncbi:MAG TPA: methyltransferase domain-containing protein [Gemmatimonadaceae bacterium]|nr:methyltransferase domain-containing protein [Gemmatimonadaceae bacterium]
MTGPGLGQLEALPALEASLTRRFRTTTTAIVIGDRRIEMLHPASADDLIDQEAFDLDERLPYWAELWPSSRVLAERLTRENGAGLRLIELGCGAGLVAVSAAAAGFRVTATDYYDDALAFTWVNVARNTGHSVDTRLVDWRALEGDLHHFDRVVGADVLYERPYGALVARAVAATLSPGGTATIADPGRVGREDFLREVGTLGLAIESVEQVPHIDGAIRQSIAVFQCVWR